MTPRPAGAAQDFSTVKAALATARAMLSRSPSAALDAQVLLAHALQVERAFLFAHGEVAVSPAQQRALLALLQRRAAGEPIAYITGSKGFYDVELAVSPAVLIPRPETELLLEAALHITAGQRTRAAADIGAGSGALAIAFARKRPDCAVFATDISAAALDIARANAARLRARVSFLQGDLALPLSARGIQVELLLANLPYIASAELPQLQVSRYEPRLALDGGADGLRLIERLLSQLPAVCAPGAWVLLEIGADQGERAAALLRARLGLDCAILPDYAGLDRIMSFQLG